MYPEQSIEEMFFDGAGPENEELEEEFPVSDEKLEDDEEDDEEELEDVTEELEKNSPEKSDGDDD